MAKYKLTKSDNFHIYNDNGVFTISSSASGRVYEQTLSSGAVSARKTVAVANEKVKLFDGKMLVRHRDKLSVY